MNTKIQKIMMDKGLSPSHFADEIEVQRSTISHILVGRNKPSLEIIQKIKRRFPDISYDWLIDEEDGYPASNNPAHSPSKKSVESRRLENNEHLRSNVLQDRNPQTNVTNNRNNNPQQQLRTKETEDTNRYGSKTGDQSEREAKNGSKTRTRAIEKVLIFYSDGTFSEFLNENF